MTVRTFEDHLPNPLIQKRAADVSPVLTPAAVAVFGDPFGVMGVAPPTSLAAALQGTVMRLLVEDRLGDASVRA